MRDAAAYSILSDHLTAVRVVAFFKPLGVGAVVRYELPNLEAFNFVLPGVLDPSRTDAQGKALGQALLELELDIEAQPMSS